MGVAYYIVAENQPEEMDIFVSGKRLAQAHARLASAARTLGLPDLTHFFSQDPEEAAEWVEDQEVAKNLPPEKWFDPEEGLTLVRALLPHFSTVPEDSAIVEELREFEDVLLRLRKAGLRWHLAIDF